MIIKKSQYTGYVWMSNSDTPIVLDNEDFEMDINDSANPFVIEAQLYDKEAKTSMSVKYVDGKHIQKLYEDVSASCTGPNVEIKEYVANPRIGNKTLMFLQYWDEKDDLDNLRCGMKELRPGKMVFVGFKTKED